MNAVATTFASAIVPLEMLAAGESATIVAIEGQTDLAVRLHEIGLRPQCEVRMVRPGTPCIVAVGDHRYSFRGAEAASVLVAPREGVVQRSGIPPV